MVAYCWTIMYSSVEEYHLLGRDYSGKNSVN